MFIHRNLDLSALLNKRSFFLFGPRSTGKTFWIKKNLSPNIPYITLNQTTLYHRLIQNPDQLHEVLRSLNKNQKNKIWKWQ